MNAESKAADPSTAFQASDEPGQTRTGAVSQEDAGVFPLDEALLQALVVVGGLSSVMSLAVKPMLCYACRSTTQERCSYCLLPVCPAHGGQVQLWFTRQHALVCLPCQARLREVARQEEDL